MLILDKQRAVARIIALTADKDAPIGQARRTSAGGRSYRGVATHERRSAAPLSTATRQSAQRVALQRLETGGASSSPGQRAF